MNYLLIDIHNINPLFQKIISKFILCFLIINFLSFSGIKHTVPLLNFINNLILSEMNEVKPKY